MRITLSFISFVLYLVQFTNSVNITCNFKYDTYGYALPQSSYSCLTDIINVNSRDDAIVDKISGAHHSGKTNNDVLGILTYGPNIPYFFKYLEKHFRNLKAIAVYSSHLKEINQSDLKPFRKLLGLYLHNDNIEIIKAGTFDYNLMLFELRMQSNLIIHIDSNVFDNLSRLTYLYLDGNICVSRNAENSASTKDLVQQIKFQAMCKNPEYSNLDENLKNLNSCIKTSNPKAFKSKLEDIESEVRKSKFSSHFATQIEALEAANLDEITDYCTNFEDSFNERLQKVEDNQKQQEVKIDLIVRKLEALEESVGKILDNFSKND